MPNVGHNTNLDVIRIVRKTKPLILPVNNTQVDFDAFMKERIKASGAFVNGEYTALGEVSTQVSS